MMAVSDHGAHADLQQDRINPDQTPTPTERRTAESGGDSGASLTAQTVLAESPEEDVEFLDVPEPLAPFEETEDSVLLDDGPAAQLRCQTKAPPSGAGS